MKMCLVILAAGMGSRFGGLKQITPITKSGESIIDFSMFDALRTGFEKIILIIRKDIYEDFHTFFGKKLEKYIDIHYAFQNMDSELAPNREKPFGTAHAVLSAKDQIREPFAVINADDYYGFDSFKKASDFLRNNISPVEQAVIGYPLKNTLSEHGSVSRAVCEVEDNNMLTNIKEILKIQKDGDTVNYIIDEIAHPINPDTPVSMNFWCFKPEILRFFESGWEVFKNELSTTPNAEFLIPDVVRNYISNGDGSIRVIPTSSPWFGITYKEDQDRVISGISGLVKSEIYPSPLWT